MKNGGSIFPAFAREFGPHAPGLSRLDWFAGKALEVLANDNEGWTEQQLAEACYRQAAAMLAESEKYK